MYYKVQIKILEEKKEYLSSKKKEVETMAKPHLAQQKGKLSSMGMEPTNILYEVEISV
jgi:hypothetical protein